MGCNPCCCFTLKDGAITIGIWTLIYSIASIFLFGWQTSVLNSCHTVTMSQANLQCEYSCPCVGASNARTAAIIEAQLGIMGWQMAAIKYERDRAANTLLPNYNTYGRFDFPSYYESYWQSPEERYYTGLFVIQILCLIAAFFLLFASVALIYGIHTWSRYLVWPWFPCVISSVLCSLAYCIMWWAGDVRSYWMAITIIEIIGVFINIYCVVVVLMYYRRVTATTDLYDGKTEGVTYNINKNGYGFDKRDHLRPIDYRKKNVDTVRPYRTEYMTPVPMPSYNPYSPNGTPLPLPPQYSQLPPYPINPNEIKYVVEQKPRHDDPVSSWVRQQTIERAEANSEPVSPSKEVAASFPPMKHARSVPSLFYGTLVSHKDCRHRDNHRNSSRRRRSRSRHRYPSYSSESDSDRDFRRHGDSRRRPRSRSRYAESEISDFTEPRRHSHRHRDSDRHRHDDNRRRNKHEDRRDDDSKGSKKRHGERKKEKNHRGDERQPLNPSTSLDTPPSPTDGIFPLSGGISIPQHIVIPPSNGERGPDGKPLPQKFQINSEITINYDHNQSSPTSEGPPRRYPIHSNV